MRICDELYQVIGSLASTFGVFEHPEVQRALDNASAGKLVHKDLLPWPKSPLLPDISDAAINAAAEVMWNDRDARMGGTWKDRGPNEVAVVQTKATAKAALQAALRFL